MKHNRPKTPFGSNSKTTETAQTSRTKFSKEDFEGQDLTPDLKTENDSSEHELMCDCTEILLI